MAFVRKDFPAAPMQFKTDESALRQPPVGLQHKRGESSQSTELGSSQPSSAASKHDMWSGSILPGRVLPFEAIPSRNFRGFPFWSTPQTLFPETLPSVSSDSQSLPLLASEDDAGSTWVDFVEPHQYEFMDKSCPEMVGTGVALAREPLQSTRFSHRLDAPPALTLKELGGSPVTYLNKGSPYSILVEDKLCTGSNLGKKMYCTSVQVVFDTEQQRQQSLAYWQMWEQSRDDDGVRSQAVEYIGLQEFDHVANIQVVHSDGFSVVWSADHSDMRQYSITFQLNFRSTDFSQCKGVIGVPMRLCCATEEISTSSVDFVTPNFEMSFCRIKSFRNHGAERKNANDMAIAAKRIRRLKQQLSLSQTEQTSKDRLPSHDKKKILGSRKDHEVGLLCKLNNLQQACNSIQPYTFLGERGAKQQDCDWSPSAHEDKSLESLEPEPTLSYLSPRSNFTPMTSRPKQSIQWMPTLEPIPCPNPSWYGQSLEKKSTQDSSENIKKPSLRERGTRVACFYICPIGFRHISQSDHYIAVYLLERTACDLTLRIAEAVSVDPGKVGQTTWCNMKGLTILVEDDVVANMVEGQDMLVEARYTASKPHLGRYSSLKSADEMCGRERAISYGTQELLEFNLLF